MNTVLSIRLAPDVKERLDALAKASNRSRFVLAAEAIASYVEAEEWQMGEIPAAINDLDAGHGVEHDKAVAWMESWGKKRERKAPQ